MSNTYHIGFDSRESGKFQSTLSIPTPTSQQAADFISEISNFTANDLLVYVFPDSTVGEANHMPIAVQPFKADDFHQFAGMTPEYLIRELADWDWDWLDALED